MLSAKELGKLAGNGAGLVLDARRFTHDDLIAIVGQAGGTVTIGHIADLRYEDLKKILGSAGGEVVFDTTS